MVACAFLERGGTMSWSELFEQAVAQRVAEGPAPWKVEVAEGDVTITAELSAAERLACAVSKLEVRNGRWAGASLEQVKKVAERLSQRLTYLLEPVRPIEADVEQCIVQMRSSPPRIGETATSYYELQVSKGALNLQRFEKVAGEPRQAVDVEVTRVALRQLVEDMAAAA